MPAYKYPVTLSPAQRQELKALCGRGEISARKLARARILLLADQNRPQGAMEDHQIHEILSIKRFAFWGEKHISNNRVTR